MRFFLIPEYCKLLGISQNQLAAALGIEPTSLSARVRRKHIISEKGQFYAPTRTKHNQKGA